MKMDSDPLAWRQPITPLWALPLAPAESSFWTIRGISFRKVKGKDEEDRTHFWVVSHFSAAAPSSEQGAASAGADDLRAWCNPEMGSFRCRSQEPEALCCFGGRSGGRGIRPQDEPAHSCAHGLQGASQRSCFSGDEQDFCRRWRSLRD